MTTTWVCTLDELVRAVKGQALSQPHSEFHYIGTDTRQSLKDMLFVPLKGENFNAHDFVPKAIEQGARVVLVQEWRDEWKPLFTKASFVRVIDALQAVQMLARYWRHKHAFEVNGITGSNGKTSTK